MSVRKRGDRWVAIAELGRDPVTGVRQQQWLGTFKTRKAAEQAERAVMANVDRGVHIAPSKQPLAAALSVWIERRLRENMEPSTAERYRTNVRTWVAPDPINATELGKLRPTDFLDFYDRMRQRGASPSTISHVHAVISACLNHAVRIQELATNPAVPAKPPHPERKTERRVWTVDEALQFLAAHEGNIYQPMVKLALFTTLRRSELCGLRWADIDWERGFFQVKQAAKRDGNGRFTLAEPKNEKRKKRSRVIMLNAVALDMLRTHRTQQLAQRLAMGPVWQDHGLVFCREDGTPINPHSFYQYFTRRMCADAGVPRIKIHELRHTSGTLLRRMGMDLKVLQQVMGHASSTWVTPRASRQARIVWPRVGTHVHRSVASMSVVMSISVAISPRPVD